MKNTKELRTIPIHTAINRPILFMGGDRELVLFAGVLSFVLIFSIQSWAAVFFGIVLWIGALFILRLMAKNDPLMRHVYLRHKLYARYYPPRSTPYRINRKEL